MAGVLTALGTLGRSSLVGSRLLHVGEMLYKMVLMHPENPCLHLMIQDFKVQAINAHNALCIRQLNQCVYA